MIKKIVSAKLSSQLVVSFIAISFIILAISSLFTYYGTIDILKMRSEQSIDKQYRQFSSSIQSFIDGVDKISKLLLVEATVQKFLEQGQEVVPEKIVVDKALFAKLSEFISNDANIDSIYIYTEDGRILGVTAKTNEYLLDSGKQNDFYHSDIYEGTQKNNLSLVWTGGKKSKDFDLYEVSANTREEAVVTAARGIKSLYQSRQSATLVINIKERALNSIYNYIGDPSSSTYIVDSKGEIVSSNDPTAIGRRTLAFNHIDAGLSNGSFTLKQNSDAKQFFYLQLENIGWTIVNEINMRDYAKDISVLKNRLILMFAICFILALILSVYWVYVLTKPIKKIFLALKQVGKGNVGHTLAETPNNEFGMIVSQFNQMSVNIAGLIHQNQKIEEEKRKQEIAALQLQINPHFLYNTLNTIKLMAVIAKSHNIVEGISILGNMMRSIFQASTPMCTIEEEIQYLSDYIKIMNLRYGEGIKMIVAVPDDLLQCRLLRFILQPIVENAIHHGLAGKGYIGEIRIEIKEQRDELCICVCDDGVGIAREKHIEIAEMLVQTYEINDPTRKGIGIRNVAHRIRLHFGEKYGLELLSAVDEGTTIRLNIPKMDSET